jgi:hypothetical protein
MEGPAAFVARLHATTTTFGPDAFNFRDLAMKKRSTNCDYFNMPKPVRGSSPTASLAADLSQNMHIDQRYALCKAQLLLHRTDVN